MRGTGAKDDSANWSSAARAGLICPAIGGQGLLKEAALAIDVDVEIIERGAALFDRFVHYLSCEIDERGDFLL